VSRYKVVEGSQSDHCCFYWTVVDTTRPVVIGETHWKGMYEAVCECFKWEDADNICASLNYCEDMT
jgi:hypothetical protein